MKIVNVVPVLVALALTACGDREKVVEKYQDIPKPLGPSNSTDGFYPFTPENAVRIMKAEWLNPKELDSLMKSSRFEGSNIQYVGAKDKKDDSVFMTESDNFKKFMEEEVKRIESEYPQYKKFIFTARNQNFRLSRPNEKVQKFDVEPHYFGGGALNPNFRIHEDLKWRLAGADSAAQEASAKLISAYNGNGMTIQCYGEYSYSYEAKAYFDLTRCDVFGPNGQPVATTSN